MPRVAAISDLHGRLPRVAGGYPAVPPCDVLVLAGDIAPDFHGKSSRRPKRPGSKEFGWVYDRGENAQSNWLNTDFRGWLEDVRARCGCEVVGIAGNHDFAFESKIEPKDLPWRYLWDAEAAVAGLRFYGVPWCPKLGRWAFYADDRRLTMAYAAVPERVDVLISHSPPLGYGDTVPETSRFGMPGETLHVGTPQLTNTLSEKAPRCVVSGHIHEGRGRHEYPENGTVVYNVAYLDDDYNPHPGDACTILDVLE